MSRAIKQGLALRQELGLQGQVETQALTDHLGLVVRRSRFHVFEEMRLGNFIAVADRFEPEGWRWAVAHAVGHGFLHVGNHFWMRRNTDLGRGFEREAEDFAFGLLVDPREAAAEGCVYSWQVAEHFGVPDEMVRAYMPFAFQQ
ncbi:MAG: ImmA/IrrE family metallo-endopeptidase [Dehalococcoidia bacterium]|nr:ImmA/IrrE family metallo-endopeptidase [Dehalococcoidia bacterium]